MPAPICVKCGLTMRCHRNDQQIIVTTDRKKTQPYKIYRADVYECSECGARVATGFGKPIERHDPDFQREAGYVDAVWAF